MQSAALSRARPPPPVRRPQCALPSRRRPWTSDWSERRRPAWRSAAPRVAAGPASGGSDGAGGAGGGRTSDRQPPANNNKPPLPRRVLAVDYGNVFTGLAVGPGPGADSTTNSSSSSTRSHTTPTAAAAAPNPTPPTGAAAPSLLDRPRPHRVVRSQGRAVGLLARDVVREAAELGADAVLVGVPLSRGQRLADAAADSPQATRCREFAHNAALVGGASVDVYIYGDFGLCRRGVGRGLGVMLLCFGHRPPPPLAWLSLSPPAHSQPPTPPPPRDSQPQHNNRRVRHHRRRPAAPERADGAPRGAHAAGQAGERRRRMERGGAARCLLRAAAEGAARARGRGCRGRGSGGGCAGGGAGGGGGGEAAAAAARRGRIVPVGRRLGAAVGPAPPRNMKRKIASSPPSVTPIRPRARVDLRGVIAFFLFAPQTLGCARAIPAYDGPPCLSRRPPPLLPLARAVCVNDNRRPTHRQQQHTERRDTHAFVRA